MTPLERAARDIKDVNVQGAKEIAVYGLKFLKSFAKKNGMKLKFEAAAYFLEEVRPTAVVLHNCVEAVIKSKKMSTIDRLVRYLETVSQKIGRHASRIVKRDSVILTHCHSGEAMSFLKHAWKRQKGISVIATMTEPLDQGVRTARELAQAKIPVTLITDSAAGHFSKDADMIVVGSDALRKEGVVNKVGTLPMALAAKRYRKPFYVVADMMKIDRRKKFKIEERPEGEIYGGIANKKGLRGVKIRNPAFDVTPWQYVTAVVTEKGVKKPSQILRLIR
jgi:ribose 1,5-bisphosphate isomerase